MPRPILYLKLFWRMFRLSRNPEDTLQAFLIADNLTALGLNQQMEAKLLSDSASRDLIKNRVRMKKVDFPLLQMLPPGTVGRVYADYMIQNNLDPDIFPLPAVASDTSYIVARNRETHDLWHIVTGIDTSRTGELTIHGFMWAQLMTPLSSLLVGGALMRAALVTPQVLPEIWKGIVHGYALGSGAKSIFAVDWEKHWATPLVEFRDLYGLKVG